MTFLPVLLSIGQLATASLPFDSIATPLLTAASGTDLQPVGDQANQTLSRVRVNQAGYRLIDVRKGRALFQVVSVTAASEATLEGPSGARTVALRSRGVAVSGQVVSAAYDSSWAYSSHVKAGYPMTSSLVTGTLYEGVLPTDLAPGRYAIRFGSELSASFIVSPNVYGMVRDAALMFFGVQRSGDGSSWFHPASHLWDGWLYDTTAKNVDGSFTYKGALNGGWYQDGSHLKGSRTQSYALAMLGATAATLPGQDKDHFAFDQSANGTDGIPDVLRELKWGADFALKAWALSGGSITTKTLFLSVGEPGYDYCWWGRSEDQDSVSFAHRGGRHERPLVADWGSASLSDWAAGLAFAAKLWKPYDQGGWCDSALTVAKAFYAGAKSLNKDDASVYGYTGESKVNDDLALAATALLWATGENAYLQDLAYTTGMPSGRGSVCGASSSNLYTDRFIGGFLGCGVDGIRGYEATSWGSVQMPALHAFHKLILKDAATAKGFGLTEVERTVLEEKTLRQMIATLSLQRSNGAYVTLPKATGSYDLLQVGVDSLWGCMSSMASGWWNEYHVGGLLELALYLDATGDVISSGTALPNMPSPDWKRDSVAAMLVRGAGTLLGMNRWDLSMVLGVGAKNPMHIHHRDANPELINMTTTPRYAYRIPVGALYPGEDPASSQFSDGINTVSRAEADLVSSAALTMLATQLSQDTSTVAGAGPTGIASAKAGKVASFTVHASGDRLVLTRKGTASARLELLDPNGAVLSSQVWTGATLRIGRANALRVARLVEDDGTATHLLAP